MLLVGSLFGGSAGAQKYYARELLTETRTPVSAPAPEKTYAGVWMNKPNVVYCGSGLTKTVYYNAKCYDEAGTVLADAQCSPDKPADYTKAVACPSECGALLSKFIAVDTSNEVPLGAATSANSAKDMCGMHARTNGVCTYRSDLKQAFFYPGSAYKNTGGTTYLAYWSNACTAK